MKNSAQLHTGKTHENYKELIWMLAKTSFKLRYQGSFLGYIWAILNPLALFLVLNFVFSSIFAKGGGIENYSLQLLVSLMLFMFFSEGTNAGMNSLKGRAQLVTKIYVPRWTLILSSTIHSAMVYTTNLIVVFGFFVWYQYMPSVGSILLFFLLSLTMYILIVSAAFILGPLIIRFKDIGLIWDVVLRVMFYATPILYPLTVLPEWSHKILLLNPVAFIIHFNKEALFNGHYADPLQWMIFFGIIGAFFGLSIWTYNKLEPKIAEYV